MKSPRLETLWLLVLLGTFATGCGAEKTPEAAARRYLTALERGETEKAFESLSAESRRWLARQEERWFAGERDNELPRQRPGAQKGVAEGLAYYRARLGLAGGAGLPLLPEDAAGGLGTAEVQGDRAQVPVATPLGTKSVDLVKEGGRWAVVLAR